MSPTNKTIRHWNLSEDASPQRQPDDKSHVRATRHSGSTGRLRAVPNVGDDAPGSVPHQADDTIVASTPFAFQSAEATLRLSRLAEATVATAASTVVKSLHVVGDQKTKRMIAPVVPLTVVEEKVVLDPAVQAEATPPATKPLIDTMKLNKLIVSSYKFIGFAVLGTILLGLASFIATNLFYMFNESWVTPLQLSSTDPRVLQLTAQLSAAKAARDGVAAQQLELNSRLSDARRIASSEAKFQSAFDETMAANLQDRLGQLGAFQKLIHNINRTRHEVSSVNRAYSNISKEELDKEYKAGLINKDDQVKGGYELAQIEGANLGLHEKNVEIDARVTDLQREVQALRTAGIHGDGAMSYEVLKMKHEYEQSMLAAQKASDDADALAKSVAMFDSTLAEYDSQIERIKKAPYVQAADKNVSTAFVPYDNVGAIKVGDNVYSCAVSFLFCHKIGKIAEVLDGEILGKHPLHNRDMRGVLVRLELTDPSAIEKPVLHLHRAPMGL
jgi:hypothetical protein